MPVPLPRCVVCDALIEDWDSTRGQHPKFCGSSKCKEKYKKKPICGRCHKPLQPDPTTGKIHSATRFHEQCYLGCKVCGGPLQIRRNQKIVKGGHRLQNIYCSTKCQDHAWEGQPMPKCDKCGEPTRLPGRDEITGNLDGKALRNPPKRHPECMPKATKEDLAEQREEKLRSEAAAKAKEEKDKPKVKARAKKPNPFEDD